MTELVVFVGFFICIASLVVGLFPKGVMGFARRLIQTQMGLYLAAGLRFLFGAVLVLGAGQTAFPTAVSIIGWLTIAAGIGLLAIGSARVAGLVNWAYELPTSVMRVWVLLGVGLGLFLIYAGM